MAEAESAPFVHPSAVVILKPDRLVSDLLAREISSHWPNANVTAVQRGSDALTAIERTRPDLFITDARVDDMDGVEHLEPFVDATMPIVVVTGVADDRGVELLRSVRVTAVFDEHCERLEALRKVLDLAMGSHIYVSPRFQGVVAAKRMPATKGFTPTEKLVLSVIGDGSCDKKASLRLGMAAGTVKQHRRAIMRKAGVHHRGELMLFAIQHGFVRLTEAGVRGPGFKREIGDRLEGRYTRHPNGVAYPGSPKCSRAVSRSSDENLPAMESARIVDKSA